jgi:aminoglycoside phosphotransferase (APT) family kinase protein
MLTPEQEIHPTYLRALRQTLRDVLLPEIESPAARNAVQLCDFVLIRMIAALEELPAIQRAQRANYEACLPPDGLVAKGEPIWTIAHESQRRVPALFAQDDKSGATTLAQIASVEASFRADYEAAAKRVSEKTEKPPKSLLVTREAVHSYLDRRFPEQSLRVESCKQIPGGRSKITVMLRVAANPVLPDAMVLRIDNPGSAQNTAVRDEFPVLQKFYAAGVRAPEPLWLETDPAPLGAPFLVMRCMPGATPGDLWSAKDVSPALGFALAEVLAGVHAAETHAIWPDAPHDAHDAVAAMIAESERAWSGEDRVTSVTLQTAFCWLKQNLACIDGPSAPIHGDAHFANVLAKGDVIVCLTDWEFAHVGHPAEDLAFCRPYIEAFMKWSDFVAHYRAQGGIAISDAQLTFFGIWGYLRNAVFAANALNRFADAPVHDTQTLYIALHARARMEAMLSEKIAAALRK